MDKLIPVVVIDKVEDAVKILSALKKEGINCAEITLRTDCAVWVIKLAADCFQDMVIGAGTVINVQQAVQAMNCGAKFIVSPGLSEDVAAVCKARNIPYYPGCVTPTEIMKAISLGITTVKFFPADAYGGLKAMKALAAPFPQIKFIPTGGVNRQNLDEYLSWDKVVAVGGTFLVEEALSKWAE